MSSKKVTRRDFVADAGKLAVGAALLPDGFPMIVPRHVLGRGYQAPSDTVNVAVAGFGGMGSENALHLAGTENIVAICDVDPVYAESNAAGKLRPRQDGTVDPSATRLQEHFAKAAKYADFREMLDRQKDIDAVIVATPDHLHAVIAKAAMDRGKHVYVQKPLTWSVHEARVLRETALRNRKLVTQMGNQGHSGEGARLINEWIQAGIIGPVREVHVWTNRPVGFWPQGVPRPASSGTWQPTLAFGTSWNQRRINQTLADAMGAASYRVPPGLRWDLYLGPVAENIPYHPIYHPFNWRGWTDFGMGALGDMGAHLIDHPFWALGLTYPTSIEATSTAFGTMILPPADLWAPQNTPQGRAGLKPVSYPLATTVHYQFAARGAQPPVKLSWFDGGLYPPRPDVLPPDLVLKSEGGVIFLGEKGILMNDTYGANPRIYPTELMAATANVPKTIPRIVDPSAKIDLDIVHVMNWVNTIKGRGTASSPLEYAAQLTETMLLGVVALRAGQGRTVQYDGANMTITNIPEANQYLTRDFRSGWAI